MTALPSESLRSAFDSPPSRASVPKCPTCHNRRRLTTDGNGHSLLVCDECEQRDAAAVREERANEAALDRVARLFGLDVDEARRRLQIQKPIAVCRVHRGLSYVCACGAEIVHSATVKRRRQKCVACRGAA